MCKVSIIVPVYNAEQFLQYCVQSIQAQTYTNIELILVDDGSSDNSLSLCNTLASKDNRIIVLHQENKGVSAARNLGIKKAEGDIIGFADADDVIHPQMIERCVSALLEANADIIAFGYRSISNRTLFVEEHAKHSKYKILSIDEAIEELFDSSIAGFLCNKLYRSKVFKSENLDESLHICEDLEMNFRLLYNYKFKMCYLPDYLYGYYNNPVSASKRMADDSLAFAFAAAYEKMESLAHDNDDKYMLEFVRKRKCRTELLSFLSLYQSSPQAYFRYKRLFVGKIEYILTNRILSRRQLFLFCCEMIKPNSYQSLLRLYKWAKKGKTQTSQ